MRTSLIYPLFFILFGMIFVFFAIQQVNIHGWGFFAYVLILLATWDIGAGIRMVLAYFKQRAQDKKSN